MNNRELIEELLEVAKLAADNVIDPDVQIRLQKAIEKAEGDNND